MKRSHLRSSSYKLQCVMQNHFAYLFYLDVLYCSHVNTMTLYPENTIEIDISKPIKHIYR